MLSLRNQYAGRDKWEAELKRQDNLLHTRVWKGQSNFSLEKFISQHRNAFVSMGQCAEHVVFQLPNEYTRVGYLLDAIETTDAGLQAAIAQVKTDDGPDGKRNHFEAMASYLLPYDPVAKRRPDGRKRDHDTNVSATTADVSSTTGFGSKPGVGKTGVHLRYHTHAEYKKLTSEQKVELREWRETKKKKDGKTGKTPKDDGKDPTAKQSKQIATAVAKELVKQLKPKDADKEDDVDAMIMSLQSATPEEKPPKKLRVSESTTVNTSALKSILQRVKNTSPNT